MFTLHGLFDDTKRGLGTASTLDFGVLAGEERRADEELLNLLAQALGQAGCLLALTHPLVPARQYEARVLLPARVDF